MVVYLLLSVCIITIHALSLSNHGNCPILSLQKVIDGNNIAINTDEITSSWNKGVASLRDLAKK